MKKTWNKQQIERFNQMNPIAQQLILEEIAEQEKKATLELPRNGCEQLELFDVSISVSMLLWAWSKGDDCAIQNAISALDEWSRKREDRLTEAQINANRKKR